MKLYITNNHWKKQKNDIADEAFLSPGWGVWVPGNTYSPFIYSGTI